MQLRLDRAISVFLGIIACPGKAILPGPWSNQDLMASSYLVGDKPWTARTTGVFKVCRCFTDRSDFNQS